jgi:hypothetical protein
MHRRRRQPKLGNCDVHQPNFERPFLADSVSFLADEPNFSGPLMRSTRGDVRDHIDLHKRNHEPSYWS